MDPPSRPQKKAARTRQRRSRAAGLLALWAPVFRPLGGRGRWCSSLRSRRENTRPLSMHAAAASCQKRRRLICAALDQFGSLDEASLRVGLRVSLSMGQVPATVGCAATTTGRVTSSQQNKEAGTCLQPQSQDIC